MLLYKGKKKFKNVLLYFVIFYIKVETNLITVLTAAQFMRSTTILTVCLIMYKYKQQLFFQHLQFVRHFI
jgi:hypothetical protein